MKRTIFLLLASAIIIFFTSCGSQPDAGGVRYIRSKSRVTSGGCSLCFENTTDKALEFCVYGIFGDNDRILGLDESGKLKTAVVYPYSTSNIEFCFQGYSDKTIPRDVVIIGEYKQRDAASDSGI